MSSRPESGVTRRPAAVLLRAGGVAGGAAGAVTAAVSLLGSGRAGGSALVGTALALAALSVGPLLMAVTRTISPPAVMAVSLAGYAITVLVLAIAYVVLGAVPWLSGDHVAYGMVSATVAWLGGQARAVSRLRLLAFGGGTEGDVKAAGGGSNGSPASPSRPAH